MKIGHEGTANLGMAAAAVLKQKQRELSKFPEVRAIDDRSAMPPPRKRPARARIARCVDIVFCGTSISLANSPAGMLSGSLLTSRRKVSSRVA